jgi:hypothetical protein
MPERLDPLAGLAPRPARPPLWCAAAGLLVFLAGALAAYVLFTAVWLLAEPTRNTGLAILGFFLLFAGTGASSGLGLFTYHRLGRRVLERRLRDQQGEVHGGDWRSGGDG